MAPWSPSSYTYVCLGKWLSHTQHSEYWETEQILPIQSYVYKFICLVKGITYVYGYCEKDLSV